MSYKTPHRKKLVKINCVKTIKKIKTRAQRLKREIDTIYYAYRNPGTPMLPKIIIVFTIGYALSPIDLIPDFIPVIGHLDDLIIVPALIALSLKLIPKEIMEEAREMAENETIKPRKNWFFAILFIFIWLILIATLVLAIVRIVT